jgi:hypothetical protein
MIKQMYFYISILGIALLAIMLISTYDQLFVFAGVGTEGDPYTVCAAGCDYTSINAAFAAVSTGDYIEVQGTYSTSTETWPLSTEGKSNITLTCDSQAVTIAPGSGEAQPFFNLTTSTVISGCTLDGSSVTNSNPLFNMYLGSDVSITNNVIENFVFAAGDGSIVSNNDITYERSTTGVISLFDIASWDDVTITSNTIDYTYTGSENNYIFTDGGTIDNLTISSNTIAVAESTNGTLLFNVQYGGSSMLIQGNTVRYAGGENQVPASLYFNNVDASSLVVTHNTFFLTNFTANGDDRAFMSIEDDRNADTTPLAATTTYNIFYYDGTGTTTPARALQFKTNVASSRLFEDYNGFAGEVYSPAISTGGSVGVAVTSGGNSQTTVGSSPLRDGNGSTADDFELNPMSNFIDVNGTIDMGAVPAVRGSSFTIDDDGAIDYSSVHATSTRAITNNARSGDTWTIAAGTYLPFSLTSTSLRLSNITIEGAGASTIINGTGAYSYGVGATGISDLTLQDMVIQNASSSESVYTVTNVIFDYDGKTYDDSADVDFDANATLIFVPECEIEVAHAADGYDITDITGSTATSDWHLALVDFGDVYVTVLVPGQYASSAAEVSTACFDSPVDAWVASAFSVTDGTFTYNSAAVTAASVTLTSGYTDPPAITRTQTSGAGLRFSNTGAVTVTNVTSTANAYGIDIDTSAGVVTVNSSTIQNSTEYDVVAATNEDHVFNNVTLTAASSTITGTGSIVSKYTARAYIQSVSATALSGVGVQFIDAGANATTTVTTTAGGYTPYTSLLTAFVLSSGSTSVTASGYNPYTVTALVSSTYSSTSTNANLNSVNQLFTLTMLEGEPPASGPDAPSSITTSTIATSSITMTWTDNSADETSFLFDYVQGTDAGAFPGTTSSLAADTTSTQIAGLTPNTPYLFRVAAVNNDGTSAYVTSSVVYTNPEVPGTPSATATGADTVTVTWSGASNPGTTVYEVYNVTTDAVFATTTATTSAITGLSPNVSYQFKIRAQYLSDSGTYTAYSENSTAVYTYANQAAAPTVTAVSTTELDITINTNSNPSATTYAVYNATDGNYLAANGSANGATAVYQTTSSWDGLSATGLAPNTSYQFTVIGRNGDGVDAATSTVSTATYTHPVVPGTPTATATGQTTMAVSWNANNNASGTVYELYNVSTASIFATTTATNYSVTGLSAGTSYQFKVRAQYASDSGSYTNYSSNSSAVSTNSSSSGSGSSQSSGGSGAAVTIIPPKLTEGVDAMNGALVINSGAARTNSRTVTLAIHAEEAVQMAISNTTNFDTVGFEPFLHTFDYVVSPGNGIKTVYVKLRSSNGETITITDTIELVGQPLNQPSLEETEATGCLLDSEMAYRTPQSNAVYYITTACTKRPFQRSDVYFTYFTSWNDVQLTDTKTLATIPEDLLGFMPWGPLYNPTSGALIKIPNDAKVYFLLDETIYHIANEAAAMYQFGPNWNTWIDTVDPRLKDTYSMSSIVLDSSTRLDGMLISYVNDNNIYRIETVQGKQVKRWIENEIIFEALDYRFDRVVTIPSSEVYPDGDVISMSDIGVQSDNSLDYIFTTFLQRGDVGPVISILQERLQELGYFPVGVSPNGVFGPTTEEAVKILQRVHGINPVGYVGPATRAVLNQRD